tara:strand:+ start:269 stop:814 length:546 start_codon:yes stop_codon:yes gene_type:complete
MAGPIKRKMGVDSKDSGIDISSHILSEQELEFRTRLSEMKKAHKAEIKELEKDRAEYRALTDMKDWQKLTALKKDLNKIVREKGVAGWNLKKMSTLMEYYTYQHPKKPVLKSDNESDIWVQEFLSNGGNLATLISTADKSRIATWQRISGRKKRKKKSTTEPVPTQLNLEGVKSKIRKETS